MEKCLFAEATHEDSVVHHFKMNGLLIIAFFCFLLLGASCGQASKGKSPKRTVIAGSADSRQKPSRDTGFPNELASSQPKDQFPIRALGWTSDYEHIFSDDQVFELDSIISKFEKETTNEIAIVTIESSWATTESFDSLTLAIANHWGVGKKEKNNGILIGISTGLRKIRIQNGYGIETNLTNAETKKIIDDIILPEFKKGNYFEGTRSGLFALMQKIR
ncbi:MAG: TPM domain-containing protein [Chitinophagaceae bacterium]|nr:TPM domain-containing protein [Chitinophagaceae bacterium]